MLHDLLTRNVNKSPEKSCSKNISSFNFIQCTFMINAFSVLLKKSLHTPRLQIYFSLFFLAFGSELCI